MIHNSPFVRKPFSSSPLFVVRMICVAAAALYLLFGVFFQKFLPEMRDPMPPAHRIVLAIGFLLVFILSYRVSFVKKYIMDFMVAMMMVSYAHLAMQIVLMGFDSGSEITLLMIIPLFNALLYSYRRLLFVNCGFFLIFVIALFFGEHAQTIWFLIVVGSITIASHFMAMSRRVSAQRYENLFNESPMALAFHKIICDKKGQPVDYRYLAVNSAFEDMVGFPAKDIIDKTVRELFPKLEPGWVQRFGEVALNGSVIEFVEYGENLQKYLEVKAYQPSPKHFVTIFTDITEKRKVEAALKHRTDHDWLTGLFTRRYFEDELERLDSTGMLPISIVIADVNGLKLVNDSLGHQEGDILLRRTAQVLSDSSRGKDIVARWGGDEFALLLPDTPESLVSTMCSAMVKNAGEIGDTPIILSISLGYATKTDAKQNLSDILKQAEDHMYRHKSMNARTNRRALIQSFKKVLQEKNHEMIHHGRNVQLLSVALGKRLGLERKETHELSMLSAIHDIGKVAIPESIIQKPGPLTVEEWEIMKRHPEIGYRIALASLDLVPVAESVLSHHEWYNGQGYPKGLVGNDIPLLARILAVTDSFEAMLGTRPYITPKVLGEAKKELLAGAGKQFDPEIVTAFLQMIEETAVLEKLKL
jgi:diguanylate cyclase (GGDEF)-like protein/PAS domain S-box-containing protein